MTKRNRLSRPSFPLILALLALGPLGPAVPPSPAQEVSTFTGELPGGVGGVATDALGYVYVADFGERVWKIDPSGEIEVLADGLYGASGNAVDRRGRLLQSEFFADRVIRIGRGGEVEVIADEGLAGPVGLAPGTEDGEVFVCNCRGNNVARIAPDGSVAVVASGDLFRCPNGIVRTSDGDLYVVNFRGDSMVRIASDGEVSEFATLRGGAAHLTQVGDTFYVTQFNWSRILTVSEDGEVADFAGTGLRGFDDGPVAEATFTHPNGIAADPAGTSLYVNELRHPVRTTGPRRSHLRRIRFQTLASELDAAWEEGGVDAVVRAHRAYRKSHPGQNTEAETNRFGYRLLSGGEPAAAIRVFALNVEDYPDSWNAYDSLAEAHTAAGEREEAIRLYRESLRRNPGNGNARAWLEELGAEPDE